MRLTGKDKIIRDELCHTQPLSKRHLASVKDVEEGCGLFGFII